jgi:hypothetical protein
MALKAAFIFIAPNADPAIHRSAVETEAVTLISVGVSSYETAVDAALKLVAEGVVAFELCGGFGNRGTAMISEAVKGKAAVGVVRFDIHPGLDNKSGDDIF